MKSAEGPNKSSFCFSPLRQAGVAARRPTLGPADADDRHRPHRDDRERHDADSCGGHAADEQRTDPPI